MEGGGSAEAATCADGLRVNECTHRVELEALLEQEADGGDTPYLGNICNGEWQVPARATNRALEYVLASLVERGLACCVEPKYSGKTSKTFVVLNTYERGEPFPKPPREPANKRAKGDDEEGDEEEGLAEIELQRLRNIERNKEILRQLGLG